MPRFPKVVGLWGALPTKLYTQLRSCIRPQLYYTHTHTPLNIISEEHILYMHTGQVMISPVYQKVSVLTLICGSFGWIMRSRATACQPHSFSAADAHSPVSNPPLLLLVFAPLFHLPPLFIRAGMCDMWISRQAVRYSCWAQEGKAKQGRGGEKQPCCHFHSCILHHLSLPDATAHHTPSLVSKAFCLRAIPYFCNSCISMRWHGGSGVSAQGTQKQDRWSHCIWILCSVLWINPSKAHVTLRECWSSACISSLESI